ncbi:MAG: alpha/beta hydrolase fold domain-containing protein [Methylotenera sp.]|nr:alpha/beta hydrolase fold domain-containing protein [Methylotenera sp.]
MNYLPPLELISPNTTKVNASVIWLHGLGADGHDFEPIVKKLNLPNVRFILPHAPAMAVTRNSGYIMPAWYDLYGPPNSKTGSSIEDEAGIKISQNYINTLIKNEINRGIPAERIVIAGFSQGGAIALHTSLRYPQKLAGVMVLSAYLPIKTKLATEATQANAHIPIFMAHGIHDDVISLDMSKISLNALLNSHYTVRWHEYNMAHSVCLEEIDDIREFLLQVLQ